MSYKIIRLIRTIFPLRLCLFIKREGFTPLLDVFLKEEVYGRKGGRGFDVLFGVKLV
jgi:hypothetical protein